MRERLQQRDGFRWIALVVLLSGIFAVGLSFTLLSVVLPDIEDEFGVSFSTAQWVVTGPILVFGVFGPVMGKLADIFGARRVYLVGFTGAAVMFLLTSFSWSFTALLVFRLVGALEGAATAPAAIKFIASIFDPEERPKAIGWESFIMAFSPAFGLLVGTALVPVFGWRAMFFVQFLLCIVVLAAAFVILPDTERRRDVHIDYAGAVTLALGTFSGLFALNRAEPWGFADPVVIACFVAAPVLLVAFVWIQRRVEHPLFPLHYFRRRNVWAGLSAAGLTNFAYLGGFLLAAPLLADVLVYSEGKRLLVLGFRPFAFAVVGAIAGYVVVRVGERRVAVFGAAGVALGMFGLGIVTGSSPLAWLLASLVVTGAGMGLATPAYASAVVNSLDLEDQGVAGGIAASVQAAASAAGTVVLIWVQQSALERGASLERSFALAYLVAGIVCAGAVALAFAIRPTVGKSRRVKADAGRERREVADAEAAFEVFED